MLKNTIDVKEKFNLFVRDVVKNEFVYTLVNLDESALCTAMHFSDSAGNDCPVLCFWSSEKHAKICRKDTWSGFQIKKIPLPEFLENWCIGMAADQVVVGANFDQNLFGWEEDPLIVAENMIQELEAQQKDLTFHKVDNLGAFKDYLSKLFDD